ncbi:hypothetical protein StoSoilB3_23520 [Arthrobacter sp. StoSoilB3]|nr:hypothetical protein NtRootA2_22580 [Arthrobacter sp. NtRootA2]BCW15059.1 hypothetical protein NtRootA4_20380 [Arthrobacter sp. NtRootA4]BCW23394.1 hypothetical protein NtRootC7_22610 [Arthrobacter sp. NtRootC7]BCW27662.1 hypothetical protein NtRootC45_22620 [Arthrobacter sp. NtRootC45]BCW31930.1 hypothetical protein NtRootD5_22610 [Arthrobacter sp. NtRootD5]BCW40817.1 hypothetical protein StoSoilB3_23520 [Arthrobacter sp. StoSoilB3]GGV25774.1 hypothetical protein GCM10010212_09320 [Paenar
MLQYEFSNSELAAAWARVLPTRISRATVLSSVGYQSGMEDAAGTPGNEASVASSLDGMLLLSIAGVITLRPGTDKIDG